MVWVFWGGRHFTPPSQYLHDPPSGNSKTHMTPHPKKRSKTFACDAPPPPPFILYKIQYKCINMVCTISVKQLKSLYFMTFIVQVYRSFCTIIHLIIKNFHVL
jgi:hypothetical protein